MVLTPCKTGDLSLLRAIIDKHPSPSEALEQRDSVGKTPLMRAIKYAEIGAQTGTNPDACSQ